MFIPNFFWFLQQNLRSHAILSALATTLDRYYYQKLRRNRLILLFYQTVTCDFQRQCHFRTLPMTQFIYWRTSSVKWKFPEMIHKLYFNYRQNYWKFVNKKILFIMNFILFLFRSIISRKKSNYKNRSLSRNR